MTFPRKELDRQQPSPHAAPHMPQALDQATRSHAQLERALQHFLRDEGAVSDLRVMEDGHAGLTFGFSLRGASGARDYILKKAPEGVPLSGSTDVHRQVPLLRALSRSGFPAPNVPWASDSTEPLGAPFIVMERLPGRSIIVWEPSQQSLAAVADASVVWTEAARLMGALHAFDWREALSTWQAPTSLPEELDRWTRLLRHMQDENTLQFARALAQQLGATMPSAPAIGLLHGDLQPGNVLYADGRAHGLIDWDLASIGPLGMDVGWLLMIADAEGWAADWKPWHSPAPEQILAAYQSAGGALPDNIAWHRAFAFFRMTAITGLNVKLHRDGRRHDPIWEKFDRAVPFMLRRAHTLLADG